MRERERALDNWMSERSTIFLFGNKACCCCCCCCWMRERAIDEWEREL